VPGLSRTGLALGALLLGAGCARMAPPPGGPPDRSPPQLVATFPESVAVLEDFDDWVVLEFNEVIDEGGQPNMGSGTGELERLVLLSPDTLVPRISWRRRAIGIRPREGWQPNTTYRIELAPGLQDLRGNVLSTGAVVTFTTGGPLPTTVVSGRAVDWAARRFLGAALVEAITTDSLVYRTLADSSGRFQLGPLPAGDLLLRVSRDENRNRRRDGRDPWDTVRVAPGGGDVGEVWVFARDTLPPRPSGANAAARVDSFTIALTLTQPVDPALVLGADAVQVVSLPDSASIGAITALPEERHDSTYKAIDEARRSAAAAAAAAADSARADSLAAADTTRADTTRADTTAVRPPARAAGPARPGRAPTGAREAGAAEADTTDRPTADRPRLSTRLLIRSTGALRAGTRYRIEVRGVRAAGGAVGDVTAVLEIPEDPKPAATPAATDTLPPPAPPDTTTGTPRR
jgi:hypothetical protein